jgi:DNA-binding MarR family transcriptional regulator
MPVPLNPTIVGDAPMKSSAERTELEIAAEEIFELTKMSWMARSQQQPRKGQIDLTESEFLALDWLTKADPEPLSVGEIQRRIHVLPAQMSRVVRSLEAKAGKPLIRCRINPKDKRKIDVTLTDAGKKAHQSFREARLAATIDMVSKLPPTDRVELMRILGEIKTIVRNQLSDGPLRSIQ